MLLTFFVLAALAMLAVDAIGNRRNRRARVGLTHFHSTVAAHDRAAAEQAAAQGLTHRR